MSKTIFKFRHTNVSRDIFSCFFDTMVYAIHTEKNKMNGEDGMLEQGQGEQLRAYRAYLTEEEKRPLTIEKYVHEVGCLYAYLDGAALCREKVLDYKQHLTRRYKATSAI